MSDSKKGQFFKKIKKNRRSLFVSILLLLNILVPTLLIASSNNSLNRQSQIFVKRDLVDSTFEAHEVTQNNIAVLQDKLVAKQEQERKQAEREENIRKVENLFARYNAPMSGYAEIIVRRAEECGGDFKVLVGIAGNESGFGRIPYKLYNPYGYLDGRQYSGWNESLEFLSCVISQRFLNPCNNDLRCIINRYGGPDTDKERWIWSVQFFINSI